MKYLLANRIFMLPITSFLILLYRYRPFALRGHVSFAAMLEGKQIGCYALLWKKWLPLITRKGKYIKFPRHFWLCFKPMGYLQTCMMCTSLSDSGLKIVHLFIALINRFRCPFTSTVWTHFLALRICKLTAFIVVSLTFLAFKGL